MNAIPKALIFLGTVGGIFGGGYGVSYLLRSNEITDKLIKNGYKILPSNSESWKTILKSYKTVATSDNKLRFGVFSGEGNKAEEEIKRHCENLLKTITSENQKDENNYKKAEKWCVAPVTVSTILKSQGYTALKTDSNDNKTENNSEWITKIKEHKKSEKKIANLVLEEGQNTAKEDEIKKIKEKCAEIGGKKNHEASYETNLKDFINWCSNKAY